ncbi:unnamed protein product [Rotaria magnacalcarata]|uniref:CKK domain-containing protein n=8 Tax=Rotaria magnacalcarata TaxID=392030 RepID=A0A815P814_9BILA|nr:unnamed protein product [Rotaria magnacalcarata]CAF1677471.1 unnamed protein product [Rotaria magnacalcarata]
MTTVVTNSNSEVSTPTSYVSRWIAQSHGKYHKKPEDYYSSTCDCQISSSTIMAPIMQVPTNSNFNPPITTWHAQAQSRLQNTATTMFSNSSFNLTKNIDNNELQEKLNRVRALLDAKKQRLCLHISSASSSHSIATIPLVTHSLQNQVHHNSTTTVGDQLSSPPSLPSSSSLALENAYHTHDEPLSSSDSQYAFNTCHHHHNHSLPSILPCLMEESPSDSGLSDGTKTTNQDDINEATSKNAAIIDLSKPLSKEEMLAIVQIIRELWKKQFDCEMPTIEIKPTVPITSFKCIGELAKQSNNNNNKIQYHSTPSLNKLSAELNDIKDKLKRFSTGHQQPSTDHKSTELENNLFEIDDHPYFEDSRFVSFDTLSTPQELEQIQAKKDALIQRQNQRREEQLIKKQARQVEAAENCNEYRLFEEYLTQRRQEDERRRTNILQAHMEQKRLETDPLSSHDYYFAAARQRERLKRKPSISSFLSLDDDLSYSSSLNLMQTPKRNTKRFDIVSASLTAPTTASKSKMNRAASICNINRQYDSSTSLNSKAIVPTSLFGGSLMNLSKGQTPTRRSMHLVDDAYDDSHLSASRTSLATSLTGSRLARSQTVLSTKSNKQTILNSLKQVVLAGSANDKQREIIVREIESSEARHFVLLFRDHRLQLRAIYMYIPETDIIEKLYGIGPNIITEVMVDKWFKYNSGGKRFTNIPIKHFSIQCDAITIYNDFWKKKLFTNMNKIL